MSRVTGQLVTCDRCGEQTFLKHIGYNETNGSHTRKDVFEALPNGWGGHKDKTLCPDCFEEWNRLQAEFKNKEIAFFKGVKND